MPAKLQLHVLRTLQSSARHGTQTLKNSNFLERFHKDLLQHLCLRFTQVAPYFIIQLFDLPSRHAENLAPLLASCRTQYTNCFSSSSNGQVPTIISLYLRVDLSPFYAKIFQISYRVPMIWLDVFQVFFVFLVISQHSLHS
ncbi:ANM_HP_G0189920.mRNA.1.CDS.1 [Saccharomyces cerevisiae]|nr:ANM_HP_G0185750.mRNA.1.CDS.1 [Saccharomyces cerevisiae]CAI5031286.1 ANM_HP_G0189920.mRNA.1.CDS.1 [Saccharomyces cerevisiae]CAI6943981.1 ANM_HP_G0185750.mRNA.1.CDS.1 [Saccharomyces cerevisiae]CAI6949252.1 ANM_HP_G0189920.mRNA.1.CDS.1 [Saccharomyces cerevisiae]